MKIRMLCLALGLWFLCIPCLAAAQTKQDPNLLTPDQKKFADEALRALRKIESITNVDVTKREYESRTLDMVTTVDEALRHLPESKLKKLISDAKWLYAKPMNDLSWNDSDWMSMVRIIWGIAERHLRKAEALFEAGRLNNP